MPYLYPYNNNFQNQMTPISGIPGKVVNNFQEITIGDIPTNGNVAFFIKNDLSEIQTRKWSDDGRVLMGVFKPEITPPLNISSEEKQTENGVSALPTEDIMKRFDDIEKRLDQLLKPTKRKEENA